MRCKAAPVLMVGTDAARVEQDLQAGRLSCPACEAELRPWGFARPRTLRARGTRAPPVRPRRGRCRGCHGTHVLLTILALIRRVDLAEVIGEALVRAAAGAGHRTIAGVLGLPPTTVREWLRRFGGRAHEIRAHFTRLAVWLDPSPAPVTPRSTALADAVEAIGLAAQAAGRRLGRQSVWPFVSGATGGRLLANTSSPFPASWERARLPG